MGECRKGRPSPDPFLSSSLYKVKHCLRFIAVKGEVNHIINEKKKNPITVYGGAALCIIKVSLAGPLPRSAAQAGQMKSQSPEHESSGARLGSSCQRGREGFPAAGKGTGSTDSAQSLPATSQITNKHH